jgi:WD40 repeat protein
MKDNPYVGPRPFELDDQKNFYGREREARELQALITAEREVLLYAQSGAGKTSLLNARVIPALKKQGFNVLRVARVGMEFPTEVSPAEVKNVFVFSALLSLSGEHADPRALLAHDLPGFIRALLDQEEASSPGRIVKDAEDESGEQVVEKWAPRRPPVLIFDQFEELFTTHRDRWQEARAFFEQVRQVLDDIPGLGVVFSMREDHAAALDPYLPIFANRLRVRFRLELLGPRGAYQAITRPAAASGLPFAPGVAERLVDDLRRIKIQAAVQPSDLPADPQPDQEQSSILGEVIELVQLQVVCSQLWASLPDDKQGEIVWAEIEQYGSVDQSLIAFYEDSVRRAALETGVHEREVRRWFRSQLVTPMHTRGLALRGPQQTAGLPNPTVDVLEDRHIIRAEIRAGARWYELAHDRLIDPILTSNRRFDRATETPLRVAARRWKETGDVSLLYRGAALKEAQAQLDEFERRPVYMLEPEPFEREFVEASRRVEKAATQARLVWILMGLVGLLLLVIMAGLALFAFNQSDVAENQRATAIAAYNAALVAQAYAEQSEKAAVAAEDLAQQRLEEVEIQAARTRARELASYALSSLEQNQFQRSLLLALQGIRAYQLTGKDRFVPGEQVLRDALGRMSGKDFLCAEGGLSSHLAASADGRWLAAAGQENTICLWNLAAGVPGYAVVNPRIIRGPYISPWFSPDNRWLIATQPGPDGTSRFIMLWDLTDLDRPPLEIGPLQQTDAAALSPDGRWLALANDCCDQHLLLDLSLPDPLESPIRLPRLPQIRSSRFSFNFLLFSPDGRWLLVYQYEGPASLFHLAELEPGAAAELQPEPIRLPPFLSAAFSADNVLATLRERSNVSRIIDLWDLTLLNPDDPNYTASIQQPRLSLDVPQAVDTYLPDWIEFSPDGRWLAVHPSASMIALWHFSPASFQTSPLPIVLNVEDSKGETPNIGFSADSCWLASTTGPVQMWPLYADGQADNSITLYANVPGQLTRLVFSLPNARSGLVRYAAAADPSGGLHIFDLFSIRPLSNDCGSPPPNSTVRLNAAYDLDTFALDGHERENFNYFFLPGRRWFLSFAQSGAGHIWDLAERGAVTSPRKSPLPSFARDLEVLPNNQLVVRMPSAVQIWPPGPDPAQPQASFAAPANEEITASAFSPDGSMLAFGTNTGRVVMQPSGAPDQPVRELFVYFGAVREQPSFSEDRIEQLAFSADGRWLAARGRNILAVWPADSDNPSRDARVLSSLPGQFAFDPRGRWLMASMQLSDEEAALFHMAFWRLDDGSFDLLATYPIGPKGSFSLAPGGNYLAVLPESGSDLIHLWDLRAFNPDPNAGPPPMKELAHGAYRPATAQFSPGGRWLLVQVDTRDVYILWDLRVVDRVHSPVRMSDETIRLLHASDESARIAAFSQNDRWLALGGSGSDVYLWNTADLAQGAVMLRSGNNLQDLVFLADASAAPGSGQLVTTSEDAILRFWPLDARELLRLACQQIYRDLTDRERQQYLQDEPSLTVCPAESLTR